MAHRGYRQTLPRRASMSRSWIPLWVAASLLFAALGYAGIFANLRGIVHDPQHRPVEGAQVTIRARASSLSLTTRSNAGGEFEFNAVPVGDYTLTVKAAGFQRLDRQITVTSGS